MTAARHSAIWAQVLALRLERQHVVARVPASGVVDVVGGGEAGGSVTIVPVQRWRHGVDAEIEAEVERLAAFVGRPLSVSAAAPVG